MTLDERPPIRPADRSTKPKAYIIGIIAWACGIPAIIVYIIFYWYVIQFLVTGR